MLETHFADIIVEAETEFRPEYHISMTKTSSIVSTIKRKRHLRFGALRISTEKALATRKKKTDNAEE